VVDAPRARNLAADSAKEELRFSVSQPHQFSAMASASLTTYNSELVKALEDLREQREEVNRTILRDEEEKARIQKELTALTERLGQLNNDLAKKINTRNEFDAAISETEGAYMKILESSQTLLSVLKRESVNLTKRKTASS